MMDIELQLYVHEALALRGYLQNKWQQLQLLQGASADVDFVLTEWLLKYYWAKAEGIKLRSSRKPTKIKMPVSVARILWKSWQQEVINSSLQLVLGGIDGQLANLNLKPI